MALGRTPAPLCGDATDSRDLSGLLGERKAQMAFTDPPYNVAYGDHGGQQRGTRKRRIKNDALSPEEWEAFCRGWAGNLLESVDGAVYVCMSTREWPVVSRVLGEAGAHWSDTIIWAKDRFVLGRADYQRQYEPIWFGWPKNTKHGWHGGRDQSNIWKIDRPSSSEAHPTMKPLALVERAIENSSKTGDAVLDLCEEKLKELHQETQRYTGPFDLREPGDDEVAWVRQLVEAD
jgi:DNA modification methylase